MSYLRYFGKRQLSVYTLDEGRLLGEARAAYPELDYSNISTEILAQIAQQHGIDFATALFYDRLRHSREHGPFITELETISPDLANLPDLLGRVLIAPAAFYREYPQYGGDGRLIQEVAADFGLEAKLLPALGTGSVTGNAALIREALIDEPDRSVILVSLSKGGADTRIALEAGGPPLRKVRVWLQICGLVRGTPLVDSFLKGRWWRRHLIYGFLWYMGANIRLAQELSAQPGALLAAPATAPPGVLVINVLGFPLTSHLKGKVRHRHRQLAHLGPNDGSTLLREAMVETGLTYPLWGANHYFQVPEASLLLYKLFLYLHYSGTVTTKPTYKPDQRGVEHPQMRNGSDRTRFVSEDARSSDREDS